MTDILATLTGTNTTPPTTPNAVVCSVVSVNFAKNECSVLTNNDLSQFDFVVKFSRCAAEFAPQPTDQGVLVFVNKHQPFLVGWWPNE